MWLLQPIVILKTFFLSLIYNQNSFHNQISIESDKIHISHDNQPNEGRYIFSQKIAPSTFGDVTPKLNENANILTLTWEDLASLTIIKQNDECKNYEFNTKTDDPLTVTFNISNLHLYGGGLQGDQRWPIESWTLNDDPFVSGGRHSLLAAIWYTSNGYYVSVDKKVPLFVSLDRNKLTLTAQRRDPYIRGNTTYLTYKVCKYSNIKTAYQRAISDTIGKPSDIPDYRMTQLPIWSTWAQYKKEVDTSKVLQFADLINKHRFPNSQMEIDDAWETCYGSLQADPKKFPDLKQLVNQLKIKGFRTTIWTYPFINTDCEPYYTEALKKDYYVKGKNGSVLIRWWDGNASLLDFTNPEAVSWWQGRLYKLRNETGIDSFKFDAGEIAAYLQAPVFKQMSEDQPDSGLTVYIEAASQLGNMIEVRTGRSTQRLPIFVRMGDLASSWTGGGSLATIIPQLLTMNAIGYHFVLPDMVAGNRYNGENITDELFVRWLQANVFMPSIQFSIPPWEFGEEMVKITKKYISLHAEIAPKIYRLMKRATVIAAPVNAPLWWIDPDDPVTYTIDSEFLLGDDILIAPVIQQGATSRDIYLPKGTWEDRSHPNKRNIINGPVWLRNYSASIDVLPYFVKVSTPFRGTVGKLHLLLLMVFIGLLLCLMRSYFVTRRHKDYSPI